MSGFENESVKNFIDKMYEWSSDVDRKFLDNITKNNRNGYVSWKIPLPFDLLEDTAENKSIRGICVERMIWKLYILSKKKKKLNIDFPFLPYCLITEPNFFGSEVGVFFSREKMNEFLFRNVNTKFYKEETRKTKGNLSERYNVIIPDFFSYEYFSHDVENLDDDIVYHGGFHFLSYILK